MYVCTGWGVFFPADKKYLVSQKDLISSLRGLSAGLWGQALLGGQSRGSDSCGVEGAGNLSPAAPEGPPPGCAWGAVLAALPLAQGCGVSPSTPGSACADEWE